MGKGDREGGDRGSHDGKAIAREELECERVESRSDEVSAGEKIREDVKKAGVYVFFRRFGLRIRLGQWVRTTG